MSHSQFPFLMTGEVRAIRADQDDFDQVAQALRPVIVVWKGRIEVGVEPIHNKNPQALVTSPLPGLSYQNDLNSAYKAFNLITAFPRLSPSLIEACCTVASPCPTETNAHRDWMAVYDRMSKKMAKEPFEAALMTWPCQDQVDRIVAASLSRGFRLDPEPLEMLVDSGTLQMTPNFERMGVLVREKRNAEKQLAAGMKKGWSELLPEYCQRAGFALKPEWVRLALDAGIDLYRKGIDEPHLLLGIVIAKVHHEHEKEKLGNHAKANFASLAPTPGVPRVVVYKYDVNYHDIAVFLAEHNKEVDRHVCMYALYDLGERADNMPIVRSLRVD